VIAAAALLRPSPRQNEKQIGLVTFGAPLKKLYHWAFPAYLPAAHFDSLNQGAAGGDVLWRNVFYPTDYIGGPCDESADERLSDPPTSLYVYGQPAPAVLTHTGYWRDPRFWTHVDAVANALVEPAALPQPSLFDAETAA
jgi:hypothetical protein